ncbi:Protein DETOXIFICATION [Heracleum sosnowskyi]|uniref:Protein DETOXIFICATION n=1 Tax=Heracleum sosnowskyi TaxID=360622 RepID=A0AAD8GT10_9APIA|nr:Protein DETOXIFICATION [Heracleum sosnowskyi]
MADEEGGMAVKTPENEGKQMVAKSTWNEFVAETKKISLIFIPMLLVSTSQYLLTSVSTMMVGHVGKLYLSGAVISVSFTNVTGFSVLYGVASALETLCGQAYGAKQHKKLSAYTYGAMISLLLLCIPIAILWIFMEKLLILIHQDPLIAHEAGKFSIRTIPALFPYAILQPLVRYLQSQSLVLPLLASSVATLAFHIPVCWAFVFKFHMGSNGAALAIGLSYWFNAIFLGLYAMYSPKCAETRAPFTMEAFSTIKVFLRIGIPSALMVCLEWWACEIIIFLAGVMKNPQLETSVLSISITIAVLHSFAPYSLSVAASVRVSNELGAGNEKAVRRTVWVVLVLGIIEVSIAAAVLLSLRHDLGRAFVSDNQIVDYLRRMTPFICLKMFLDSIQAILSGVARGTGWQGLGAYVNLGAYYLVGIPVALLLGFLVHLRTKGLWIGLLSGALVQGVLLAIITSLTDWKKQVRETRERVVEMKVSNEN